MEISAVIDPSRRAAPYCAAQAGGRTAPAAAAVQDEVVISPEALAVEAVTDEPSAGSVTAFPSFAGEFGKVTQEYTSAVREHYADEHAENLTYQNPAAHIWDKYKNPDSPDYRAELSEDERAWAYDQELDLLNGGKRLQLGDPYAFPEGAPTLASAAMQAGQSCREQLSRAIEDCFAQSGVEIPADASFRLTVDESCTIHVTGLEDEELAESIENALNAGDNGKNLSDYLKITGEAGVEVTGGRLAAADAPELDDGALAEVKKQTSPVYSQYSDTYSPHQEPLGFLTGPGAEPPSREYMDRACAAVRMGAPELLARYRAGAFGQQQLEINRQAAVDPDGSILTQTYIRAYAQPAMEARKTIEDYYAQAHRENSSYPFQEGLEHIAQKYKRPESELFRSDLSERQRDMYYRQERALLTGARVTLLDPYALASAGGVQTVQASHEAAMQAVREKVDALWAQMYGVEG